MELRFYLSILWRRKLVIATTTAMTVIVTVIGTLMIVPVYTASTTLRIVPSSTGSGEHLGWDDIQYADRLINTYSKMLTSDSVLQELAQRLGVQKPPKIEVEVPANTELMHITVEDQNAILAKDAANTLADILIARIRAQYAMGGKTAQEILKEQLDQIDSELNLARKNYESLNAQSPGDSERITAAKRAIELKEATYANLLEQYERARVTEAMRANTVSVLDPAITPQLPSKPRKALNIGLGLIVGLVAGVGLAFLFENLDTTLHTAAQIEQATELLTLGYIPALKGRQKRISFDKNSPQGEAFRRLRTNILTVDKNRPLHTLLVTSAEPGEGKSTIVANLACAMAESGLKVVLVDGDLRLPTIHKIFGLPNQFGLSSILQQKVSIASALQESSIPGLQVLSSGPLVANPAELLDSAMMRALICQLVERSDIVLLDTPALMAVNDGVVLAIAADGVILVVGRAQSRQEVVRAARQQLVSIKAQVLGVVVNRAEQAGVDSYFYYRGVSAPSTPSLNYPSNGQAAQGGDHTRELPPQPND